MGLESCMYVHIYFEIFKSHRYGSLLSYPVDYVNVEGTEASTLA